MGWLVALVILAGCGRLGFDEQGTPETFDAPMIDDGPASVGSVVAQRMPGGWGPLDLTAAGDLDWKHFGIGATTAVNRKATGNNLIADVMHIGGGVLAFTDKQDPQLDTSWADGTPTTATPAPVTTTSYVDTPNPNGDGFAFDVAATTTQRTLRVNAGVWCARLRLSAKLLDNSAPELFDTTWDFPLSAFEVGTYNVSFRALQDTTLQVSLLIDFNYCTTGDVGEVWLSSITLSDG